LFRYPTYYTVSIRDRKDDKRIIKYINEYNNTSDKRFDHLKVKLVIYTVLLILREKRMLHIKDSFLFSIYIVIYIFHSWYHQSTSKIWIILIEALFLNSVSYYTKASQIFIVDSHKVTETSHKLSVHKLTFSNEDIDISTHIDISHYNYTHITKFLFKYSLVILKKKTIPFVTASI
jgi:hypothetical protein